MPTHQDAVRALHRTLAYHGENRANFMRLLAIAVFYAVELVSFHGLNVGVLRIKPTPGVDAGFHAIVTSLAVAWVFLAVAVWSLLRRRIFFDGLKHIVTGVDLFLLTVLLLAADGPRSPLCAAFALAIVAAALRFSLPLVWAATAGALFGYLVLVANAHWVRPQYAIAHHAVFIGLAAIAMTGVIVGQIIRSVRAAFAAALDDGGPP